MRFSQNSPFFTLGRTTTYSPKVHLELFCSLLSQTHQSTRQRQRQQCYLVGKGTSLTGVKALMSLPNLSSSFPGQQKMVQCFFFKGFIEHQYFLFSDFNSPMAASFLGFAVRSFPSPRLAFPLQRSPSNIWTYQQYCFLLEHMFSSFFQVLISSLHFVTVFR